MTEKVVGSLAEAIEGIDDGASIMVGGFGTTGLPANLVGALIDKGVKDLTIICGTYSQHEPFIVNDRLKKVITSAIGHFASKRSKTVLGKLDQGRFELELVPLGTIAERIRAGAACIPAFYIPTGVGTAAAEGKEVRTFDGREYILEYALKADFALIKGYMADTCGNILYRMAARNSNPVMAMAAATTIVEVEDIVAPEKIDFERIETPGVFVDRVVKVPSKVTWWEHWSEGSRQGR